MKRIKPIAKFEGEFVLPGDKSITHRAVMLNACADGEATITNALVGEDCLSTCRCMRALGAIVDIDGTTIRVKGSSKLQDGCVLDCGNSGTTMRLLIGLLAGKRVHATLVGDESLSTRPMRRVAEPLSLLGANVQTQDGRAPVTVIPNALHGADVQLNVSSAQVKSAILLAGLSATGTTRVTEPIQSRDHTERMLQAMGARIHADGNTVTVERSDLHCIDVDVPSDVSSAAYFMALGALKGKTLCKNVGINATRSGIFTAFDRLGISYQLQNVRMSGGEERADVLVKKSNLRAITLTAQDVPSMIDELPLVAMLCAFADGESRITGARELRVKESDRIRSTTEMILAMGGDCQALDDGFIIRGKPTLCGGIVDSYMDHRIAMTATIGLLATENGGTVLRPECCAISFPDFFSKLNIS